MSHHRTVVFFRVDFSGDVLLWFTCKTIYLKDSNAAAHSVTAPAWNNWAINCDILILKLVIHFLAVSPPVVKCVKWREIVVTKACRVIQTNENRKAR